MKYLLHRGVLRKWENVRVFLDTGADLIVIPWKILRSRKGINQYQGSLKSTSEHVIQIIGQLEDFLLTFDQKEVKIAGAIAEVGWQIYFELGWIGKTSPLFMEHLEKGDKKSPFEIKKITAEQQTTLDDYYMNIGPYLLSVSTKDCPYVT